MREDCWFRDEKTLTVATPLFFKMIVFIQLKQRKGKFQKGYLFENVNVQPRYHSRYPLVCLEWRTLGAKVNSAHYSEHVLKRGIHFQATCGRRNWTLQHNGAPSYTAINAINFLQENVFHRTRQAASEQS